MSYSVELVGSREGTQSASPSLILRFAVFGTDDDFQVRALVGAAAPATYDVLVKQQIHTHQEGPGVWFGDVEYGAAKLGEPGTAEWSFEIGGSATQHITQSLDTAGKYVAEGTAPDFKGAIGVRNDGNGLAVDGVDIDLTSFAWSETHHLAYTAVTPAYINTLYGLRGKVNDAAWRIFDRGEVRLVAISGSARGEWTVPITFSFEASHNVTDLAMPATSRASPRRAGTISGPFMRTRRTRTPRPWSRRPRQPTWSRSLSMAISANWDFPIRGRRNPYGRQQDQVGGL